MPGEDHSYCRPPAMAPVTSPAVNVGPEVERALQESARQNVILKGDIEDQAAVICRQQRQITELEEQVKTLKDQVRALTFQPETVLDTDEAVRFYTGFKNKNTYSAVFKYLAPKVARMHYWSGEETNYNRPKTNRGKKRKLSTETEFFWQC